MGLNEENSSLNSPVSEDDDLTNLTWLQDNHLLQNLGPKSNQDQSIDIFINEGNENLSPKTNNFTSIKKTSTNDNNLTTSVSYSVPPVRYNPLVHIHAKPPFSFSSLIFMAIENSKNKALPVKEIYKWIVQHFPYYRDAPEGWKNTVRHNLSLNKCFQRTDKIKKQQANETNETNKLSNDQHQLTSKGSLWCVDPSLRPNLLQAIKKTPAHIYPYMSTAKTSTNLVQICNVNNITKNNETTGLHSNANNLVSNNNITVTIGNNSNVQNVSISNNLNQTPKKIITLNELHQKNILLPKRVLIPIAKVRREPEEADAAESMLTLTQCSTAGNLNNGDIYIITNKGENFLPIQINSNLNNDHNIGKTVKEDTVQPETVTLVSTSSFNTPADHNYFSRICVSSKPKHDQTNKFTNLALITNNDTDAIVIEPTGDTPEPNHAKNVIRLDNQKTKFLIINNSNVENNGLKLINKLTPSINLDQQNEDNTNISTVKNIEIIHSNSKKNKKSKVDVDNDEDGLKCAEALYNLANGSIVKLTNSTKLENTSFKISTTDTPSAVLNTNYVTTSKTISSVRQASKRAKLNK